MMKNYKTIKNLLLLSTLSIFCYSNALALEMDVDEVKANPDKVKKTICKRTNEQAGLKRDKKDPFKKHCCEKDLLSITKNQDFLAKDFLDTEMDIEKKEEDAAFKQVDNRLSLIEGRALTEKSTFEEEYLPLEMIDKTLEFLDLSKDQNTLLAFSTTSTKFHELVEYIYTKANEHENHRPWQVPLPLPMYLPSTLYIFNSRMRTILGLYVNIKLNMTERRDRIHFERLCSPFIRTPLCLMNTMPAIYVELLQLSLSVTQPTLFQEPFVNDWQDFLTNKAQLCLRELSSIASQENFEYQNEGALYFHYCQFVADMVPANLARLLNTPLFKRLNNSFMAVMDKDLLDLKNTQGLTNTKNFAPTWEEILAIEPAPTIQQYSYAASSHSEVGQDATDQDTKLANFTKAVEYYEKKLEAIRAVGQTLTYIDYGTIATAYLQMVCAAADQDNILANSTKAVGYYEKKLEAMKTVGQTPTYKDYGNIATAYFIARKTAADQDNILANSTKAVKYCEKKLEAMKTVGQTPTRIHYNNIAMAYFMAGKVTENVNVKVENYTKAHAYIEILLEIELNEEMTQCARAVLEEINTYLSGYNKRTPDKSVDEQQRDG